MRRDKAEAGTQFRSPPPFSSSASCLFDVASGAFHILTKTTYRAATCGGKGESQGNEDEFNRCVHDMR